MSKHRYHEIDLLRGVACLMVVASHFLYRGQKAGWIADAPPAAVAAAASYGYLGVHLFFIISGFVIFMSAESGTVRAFAASRAARLYPAIWVAAPLTALVAATFSSPHFQVSWSTVLVNMTLAPHWFGVEFVDGAYWSLVVELHFYILVALALATGWLRRAEWLIAGWLLVAGANLVRPMFPLEFWLAAKWAPLFCAGACAYLIRSRGSSGARLALLAAAYLLAMAATVGPTLHPPRRLAAGDRAAGHAVPPHLPGHCVRPLAAGALGLRHLGRPADLPGVPGAPEHRLRAAGRAAPGHRFLRRAPGPGLGGDRGAGLGHRRGCRAASVALDPPGPGAAPPRPRGQRVRPVAAKRAALRRQPAP